VLTLHGHPFSSYTWKAMIALYEKAIPFTLLSVEEDLAANPESGGRLAALWPRKSFPVLEDGEQVVIESSIIIEHLDLHHGGPRMIPADPTAALNVRFMDRIFDAHVMAPMQAFVGEHLPFITPQADPMRIERAKGMLETIYAWLNDRLPKEGWACGADFTLADCAGAPALFYADWVHPIPNEFTRVRAYRARALARPSVAQCVEGARPFRHYFPVDVTGRD
jgi:glutathione S-transferase